MNTKIYSIWEMMLARPGEWIYVRDIAYEVDLSNKQLYTLMSKFPTPPVEKANDDSGTLSRIRLVGSDEFIQRLAVALVRDKYKITDEVLARIHDTLPTAGWMSLSDLCCETGCSKIVVSKSLAMLDDVEQCKQCKDKKLYRRVQDVREHVRAADRGPQLLRPGRPRGVHESL